MKNNNLPSLSSDRIVWADLLRFIAIFMVICIHCSDPFNVSPAARANPDYNFWGSIYGAFLRPCVPLFVMLTGMLLLPLQQDMSLFYKKRMLRVVVPFLIWSLLYNLFPFLSGSMGMDSSILTKMFAYAGDHPSQSWESNLHNICMIPFNFNVYTIPLWYIYMLIGLYLYMPFFSAWLKQATDKQISIFLTIWGITLFVPYGREFISGDLLGTCAWNNFGTLYYFAGFNGYLLLGYYLGRKKKFAQGKTVLLPIILFGIGYAITYIGFKDMTARPGISEEQMELFFLYCSPNVLLMTLAVFLLIQRVRIHSPFAVAVLANITKCGLGIYMIHYFMVGVGYLIVDPIDVPLAFQIPVTAIFVFMLSWTIVALVYKWVPHYAKWIMG